MLDSTCSQTDDLMERLRLLISSHWELLLPGLVNEYEKSLSSLRAENQELQKKLFASGCNARGDSCVENGFTSSSKTCIAASDTSRASIASSSKTCIAASDTSRASIASSSKIVSFDELLEHPLPLDQFLEQSGAPDLPASTQTAEGNTNHAQSLDDAIQTSTPANDVQVVKAAKKKPAAKKKQHVLSVMSSADHHMHSFLFLPHADDSNSHFNTHLLKTEGVQLEKDLERDEKVVARGLRTFIFSNVFECISGAVIMSNAIFMALRLQYNGFDHARTIYGSSLYRPASQVWPWALELFAVTDIIYNALFVLELVLRVWAMGRAALMSKWIWYDSIIILLGVVDVLSSGGVGIHPGMMRIVRILRTVRLLRVFRSMSGFDSLVLLMKSLRASLQAAVWAFVVLTLFQLIAGLFICQYVQSVFTNESDFYSLEAQESLFYYYGSFSRATLSMYEITFANWVVACRVLTDHMSEWFTIFFIIYRCLFLFAVLKVIAAVFITETNRVLEHDDELTIIKTNRDLALFHHSYDRLVGKVDTDKDGMLSWNELGLMLKDQRMKDILPTIGFDKNDLMKLFWLIQDSEGSVSVDDFFSKLCKLKGPAKKINEMAVLKLVHKIHTMMLDVWEKQGLIMHGEGADKSMNQAVKE